MLHNRLLLVFGPRRQLGRERNLQLAAPGEGLGNFNSSLHTDVGVTLSAMPAGIAVIG